MLWMLRISLDGYLYRNLLSYNFYFYNVKRLRILNDRFSEVFPKSHVAYLTDNLLRVWWLLYLYIFTDILWYLYHSWQTVHGPLFFEDLNYIVYAPFSNFVLPPPPFVSNLHPILFLLPYLFDWMGNHPIFDVIMPLLCYIHCLMLWYFSYYYLHVVFC